MFILDTLLIGSLRFVLDKVAAAAEAEMHDDAAVREPLLEAQMRFELGEISEDDFRAIEYDLLRRLRQLRRERPRAISMSEAGGISRVEVEVHEGSRDERPAKGRR